MNNIIRHLILSLAIVAAVPSISSAQEQLSLRDRAGLKYDRYQYAEAVPIYLKLVDTADPLMGDVEKLAYSYYGMNDYGSAENWFSRLVAYPKAGPEHLLVYGSVLKSNLRYREARAVFEQYATRTSDRKRVENDIAGCDSAQVWIARPTPHKINNQAPVNTSLSEFGVFPMGNKVFYTGEPDAGVFRNVYGRTGNPFLKIYTADRDKNGKLSYPLLAKSTYNDADYHVGPIISNREGNKLYVSRTYTGTGDREIENLNRKKYKTSNIELFVYTANGEGWTVEPFAYNNVKKYSLGHACLSPDEKTLYYTSDMPGSMGGTDIWYSELGSDGKWGPPQNAGPSVNTTGKEMFPGMGADGKLYYSSDGLPGMGALDIFSTTGSRNSWSRPVNMRYPVNSAGDDFAFLDTSVPGSADRSGYLSSNRSGGKGGDDIYSFGIAEAKMILALKGHTYDKATGSLLPLTSVTLVKSNGTVAGKQLTGNDGKYFFSLEKDTEYMVLGQREKYYSDSASVSTVGLKKSDTLEVDLHLKQLFVVGAKIEIRNILYDFDKDNIRPDAARILDETVRIMRDNPTLEIEMGSHTDSRGSDIYNIDLSQRRARSAVNYLVSRGIARSRMTAKGYGETELTNKCSNGVKCTVAQHQANRRTVFTITKF